MSAEESRSLILRYFHQFTNNHDRSVLRELCSPQILDHDFYAELPSASEYVQPPGRTVNDIFPDVHDDVEVMAVADDLVAVRVFATGTHSDELCGVPATGKLLTWTATMIWRVSGGKITERWNAFDSLSQMIQLGVLPPLKHVVVPAKPEHVLLRPGEDDSTEQSAEDTQNQLKPLRMFLDVLRTGNLSLLEEVVAPDYIDHGGWIDGLPAGPQGLQQEVTILRGAFPDLDMTVEHLFAAGKYVVLRMRGAGTQQGEFFGIPATNKRAQWMSVGIYKVEHGKIEERWIDASRLPLLRQLGVIPPAPLEVLPIIHPQSLVVQ